MTKVQPKRNDPERGIVREPGAAGLRRERMESGESSTAQNIRILTVTDLDQRKALFHDLSRAVEIHKPQAVAIVGDVLEAIHPDTNDHLSAKESAAQLAALPVEHLVFVRGNHEDINWSAFVCSWPHSRRPLVASYGTAHIVGPLTILGFPCHLGSEFSWCGHLEAQCDHMVPAPNQYRAELPLEHDAWLPQLLRRAGPAGRTLWLMHEPPMADPLATSESCNPEWARAVERFQPLLTVSGHHHHPKAWHVGLGPTVCINVGQHDASLHFCVLDFHFPSDLPTLPAKIEVVAYPEAGRLQIKPGSR